MAQIGYTNKVALNENPEIANINKITDDDMNEIKQVVNDNYNNTIQITDTEPSDNDNKLWIDTGEVGGLASEITNEYSESTGLGYSADYINKSFVPFISNSPVKIQMGTVNANSSLTLTGSIVVIIAFINDNSYAQFGCRSGDITTFTKNGTTISCSVSGNTYTLSNANSSVGLRYIAFVRS